MIKAKYKSILSILIFILLLQLANQNPGLGFEMDAKSQEMQDLSSAITLPESYRSTNQPTTSYSSSSRESPSINLEEIAIYPPDQPQQRMPTSIAYVYSTDTTAANSYQSFLETYGFSTDLIAIADISTEMLSAYDLILVGTDTGWLNNWGEPSQAIAVNSTGVPILGLGEGGYSFFGNLSLYIGWPNGRHASKHSINVTDSSHPIFNTPYTINGETIRLYNVTVGEVGINLPIEVIPPSDLVLLGRESDDAEYYPLIQQTERYLLWGFTASPYWMTPAGRELFLNAVHFLGKTAHQPIFIDENADFARLGFPGDGTQKNPYRIENYIFLDSSATLIYIQDTTAYFIIQNNLLDGITGSYNGIHLSNVTHGTIADNTIIHCKNGIQLSSCDPGIMQDQAQEGINYAFWFEDDVIRWQEFVPAGFSVTQIDLYISKTGNPGNLRIAVNDTQNRLWETTVPGASISTGWLEITLATPLSVIPGNSYYIYVWSDADSPDPSTRYFWRGQTDSDYAAGISSVETGWSGYDFAFRTWSTISNKIVRNWIYNNAENGIFLEDSYNNVIDENVIFNNGETAGGLLLAAGGIGHGIYLDPSDGNTISNNHIYSNIANGVHLENSSNNAIDGNYIFDNGEAEQSLLLAAGGIGHGIYLDPSNTNMITNNYVYNNTGSGVYLENSNDNTIAENTITGNGEAAADLFMSSNRIPSVLAAGGIGHGIYLDPSNGNTITSNTISNNWIHGVFLNDSTDNSITDNVVFENGKPTAALSAHSALIPSILAAGGIGHGIYLDPSNENTIANNTIADNAGSGLYLENSNYNTISENDIFDNGEAVTEILASSARTPSVLAAGGIGHGIYLDPSNGNTITENTISNNWVNGIFLNDSSENDIIGNSIFENGKPTVSLLASSARVPSLLAAGGIGHGIYLDPSNTNTIANNDVYNNTGSGVYLENSSDNTIVENTITGNGEAVAELLASSTATPSVLAAGGIGHGIYLDPSNGNTIANNTISNNWVHGVFLYDSAENEITENIIFENGKPIVGLLVSSTRAPSLLAAGGIGHGIYLDPSNGNMIANNSIYSNTGNGVHLENSSDNTIAENTITGNGEAAAELLVSSTSTPSILAAGGIGHGIYLDPSNRNRIISNTISNNWVHGVSLMDSAYNTIAGNAISANGEPTVALLAQSARTRSLLAAGGIGHGIYLDPSDENTIANNTIANNAGSGVYLENSNRNGISGNTIHDNGKSLKAMIANSKSSLSILAAGGIGHGIYLDPSNGNTISNNNIYNNIGNGVFLNASDYTTVSGNEIANNDLYGINIDPNSDKSTVGLNNFLGNNPQGTSQARDDGTDNWFASNYWDDHDNTDEDGDGIADNPYLIDGEAQNQDASPVVEPIPLSEHQLLAPTVLYPNGGETLSKTATIEWNPAIDSWGHLVTYNLYYSSDSGKRWETLASGLTNTSYDWDTTSAKDGNRYKIKVEAVCDDGFTAEDISDENFKIKNDEQVPGWTLPILLLSLLAVAPLQKLRRKPKS